MNDISQTTDMLDQLKSLSIERVAPVQNPPQQAQTSNRRLLPIKTLLALALIGGGAAATWHFQVDPGTLFEQTKTYTLNLMPQSRVQQADVAMTGAAALPEANSPVAVTVPVVAPAVVGSGYVVTDRELALAPDIGGRLEEVRIKTGARFAKGEVLAVLNSNTAQADLLIARADLAKAEAMYQSTATSLEEARALLHRQQKLAQLGNTPKTTVTGARFAMLRLERELDVSAHTITIATLEVAKHTDYVARHTLIAPFAGVVIERHLNPGDTVVSALEGRPGAAIASLIDPLALSIEVDVAERNLKAMAPGQSARVVLDAYPDRQFDARITTLSPKVSLQKGTVQVRLTFNTPPVGVLANMAAKVTFDTPDQMAKTQQKGN